jgi:hypothetical protein
MLLGVFDLFLSTMLTVSLKDLPVRFIPPFNFAATSLSSVNVVRIS